MKYIGKELVKMPRKIHTMKAGGAFRVSVDGAHHTKHKYTRKGVIRDAPLRKGVKARKRYGTGMQIGGGYDNQQISLRHGRAYKISQGFVKKVRECASNPNHYLAKCTNVYQPTAGKCVYFGSPLLFYSLDVFQMAYNTAGGAGAGISTQKYLIQNGEIKMQIVNASNAQMFVRMYECTARHDTPAAVPVPITQLGNGFTDAGYTNAITDLSSTAFQSPSFCEAWRISKVQLLKFNVGEEKVFTLRENSPTLINMERYRSGGTQLITGLAKKTRFLLFQAWGQVASDTGIPANIATTHNIINTICTMKYEYKWTSDFTTTFVPVNTCVDAAGNGSALAVLSAPNIINEVTGAAIAEVDL